MGIDAHLIKISKTKEKETNIEKNIVSPGFIAYEGKYKEIIRKKYGERIQYEEIYCIGGAEKFKKGILDKYEENEGFMTFKEGWKYIKKERKKQIKKELEKKYNKKIKKIKIFFKEDYYIDLNY